MARPCSVCRHPERAAIDAVLAAENRPALRELAERYGISESAMQRHAQLHGAGPETGPETAGGESGPTDRPPATPSVADNRELDNILAVVEEAVDRLGRVVSGEAPELRGARLVDLAEVLELASLELAGHVPADALGADALSDEELWGPQPHDPERSRTPSALRASRPNADPLPVGHEGALELGDDPWQLGGDR